MRLQQAYYSKKEKFKRQGDPFFLNHQHLSFFLNHQSTGLQIVNGFHLEAHFTYSVFIKYCDKIFPNTTELKNEKGIG